MIRSTTCSNELLDTESNMMSEVSRRE
jgi:hypothetical protein